MSEDDDEARAARAARLRAQIDRMTERAPDAPPDVSDDATADDVGEGGVAPDEQPRGGERSSARAGDESRSGAGESPREFIRRKMSEGGEGEKS